MTKKTYEASFNFNTNYLLNQENKWFMCTMSIYNHFKKTNIKHV
jgi:hypothetical protein